MRKVFGRDKARKTPTSGRAHRPPQECRNIIGKADVLRVPALLSIRARTIFTLARRTWARLLAGVATRLVLAGRIVAWLILARLAINLANLCLRRPLRTPFSILLWAILTVAILAGLRAIAPTRAVIPARRTRG